MAFERACGSVCTRLRRAMSKPSLLIIFVTVFIDLIGFGIVMPLLPKYTQSFGAHGIEIGLIISSFSVMQFAFAPMWGRLSDRIGRRPVILVGNAGSALSYALFGYAGSLTGSTALVTILISRILAGVCGATISVASAYIADITPIERRSKSMGLIGMAFGLGFILGPAIGGLAASRFGMAGPGYAAAIFCACNFVLGCFILKESRNPDSAPVAPRPRLEQILHTFRLPKLGLLILLYFLATFCFTAFETTLPLLLDQTLRYEEHHIYYLFSYCGVVAAIVQGGLIGRLIKRFGDPRLIAGTLMVVAVSMALMPFAKSAVLLLIVLGLFAAASGANRPPTLGQISIHAPAGEQGATLGIAQSASTLARIIGPLAATALFAVNPSVPYLLAGAVAAIAGLLAWKLLTP